MGGKYEGLTNKQRLNLAGEQAWGLFFVVYLGVFLVGLVAVVVCWNLFPDSTGWRGDGVFGLIFGPVVPGAFVSIAYYVFATWGIVPGKEPDNGSSDTQDGH